MPRLEAKIIQKELEEGYLWPVYWIYGSERMKSRELLRRIRKAVLGENAPAGGLSEEHFDSAETTVASVIDSAQSLSLGGGARFIVVRDAHALKDAEALGVLCGPRDRLEKLTSVCVFLSKDLDGRKKSSKLLVEKAAVVPCEEVPENEREAWIQYLAKRRGIALPPAMLPRLVALDPWTLDIVDQEFEKLSLSQGGDTLLDEVLTSDSDAFLDALFSRDLKRSLLEIEKFADQPDVSLPLLGLLAWNVRHLALICSERESGSRGGLRLNPMVAERLNAWGRRWKLVEVLSLQRSLEELDFGMKQTPLLPLGMWDRIAVQFCRN